MRRSRSASIPASVQMACEDSDGFRKRFLNAASLDVSPAKVVLSTNEMLQQTQYIICVDFA